MAQAAQLGVAVDELDPGLDGTAQLAGAATVAVAVEERWACTKVTFEWEGSERGSRSCPLRSFQP